MPSSAMPRSTVNDALIALNKHKRKSLCVLVIVLTGTVLITVLSSKEYRSEAKLFVRLGRENAMVDPTATLGQNAVVAVPQSRESDINSAVEILQSRTLLEKTVDRLGPEYILTATVQNDPSQKVSDGGDDGWKRQLSDRFNEALAVARGVLDQFSSNAGLDDRERAILLLAKNLKIDAANKSNVIAVAYDGPAPANCQAVVAQIVDAFLDEHLRLSRTQGLYQFSAAQTQRLREELLRKETELRDLKNATGLAAPAAQRQTVVARIGRLKDELLNAETARAMAEARVRKMRDRLAGLPGTQVTTEISGFGDEGTDLMRGQFYGLELREKEAEAKYTADHPKLQHIREQMALAQAALDDENRGRKQVTKEPGRLHQQAELALLSEEPVLASYQAQTAQLRTQLADVRKELATLNENEMRIAEMQRDVDLLDSDYRKYAANVEQSRIDGQLEAQRMSNVGIAQPASYEPRPIRPRKLLNLLLGLCAALFGSVALPLVLESFDDSLHSPEDIEKAANIPALATIPRLKPSHLVIKNGSR